MERLEMVEVTRDRITYRYYPNDGQVFGTGSLMRKTGERVLDSPIPEGFWLEYASHTWRAMESYQNAGEFPETDWIAWY